MGWSRVWSRGRHSGPLLRKLRIALQHRLPDLSLELSGESAAAVGFESEQAHALGTAKRGWADSFNDRRLLETIGNPSPAEAEAYYRRWEHTALAA